MTGWGEYFGNDGTDSIIFGDGNYDSNEDEDNYIYDDDHEDNDDVSRPRRLQRRHGGRGDSSGFDPRSPLHHTIEARLLALCQEGEEFWLFRAFSEVLFF